MIIYESALRLRTQDIPNGILAGFNPYLLAIVFNISAQLKLTSLAGRALVCASEFKEIIKLTRD